MSVLLSLRSLGVTYRRAGGDVAALRDVTFDLRAGEVLSIIGESGSGKSSLALAIGQLLPPGSNCTGERIWSGFAGIPANGRDIGFVFQDPGGSLDPLIRVGDQIAEAVAAGRGLSATEAARLAHLLLDDVSLPVRTYHAWPHQLSGGQRQRVALACALAGKPKLLICDEATSALDTIVQAEIVRLILSLVRLGGMTLMFITHDIALAAEISDRTAVFKDGRLVEINRTADLIRDPRQDYTARLLASHIALDAPRLVDGRLGDQSGVPS